VTRRRLPIALLAALAATPPSGVPAQAPAPGDAPLPLRRLAPGVYAVVGDTGRGSEGRPNAGFVVTGDGVLAVDALRSPREAVRMARAVRSLTRQPVRWLVLTHHHPDHHFGAITFRRAGAEVIAHADRRVHAAEAGKVALAADWTRVVGREAMRGFEYANDPDRAVTAADTLRPGGQPVVITHPGAAHSPGDLVVWLPRAGVLFAGDLLVEDGVTMVVDGNSGRLLRALDLIDSLAPRVVVPGHGAIPASPRALVRRTRDYVTDLRARMRDAVERGVPMQRALAALPPPDEGRPVSLNSRRRRNAVRVYLEEEKAFMGLESP
jgi:glyoxylase-like metal-dependent hydrolase (beta-lactamase superfamily II)